MNESRAETYPTWVTHTHQPLRMLLFYNIPLHLVACILSRGPVPRYRRQRLVILYFQNDEIETIKE
jgi:hypothetical protein